jgi:hypothetical protein
MPPECPAGGERHIYGATISAVAAVLFEQVFANLVTDERSLLIRGTGNARIFQQLRVEANPLDSNA